MNIYINDLLKKARQAQKKFEEYNQIEVDKIVKAIGKIIYNNAERLVQMAVNETQMGV